MVLLSPFPLAAHYMSLTYAPRPPERQSSGCMVQSQHVVMKRNTKAGNASTRGHGHDGGDSSWQLNSVAAAAAAANRQVGRSELTRQWARPHSQPIQGELGQPEELRPQLAG